MKLYWRYKKDGRYSWKAAKGTWCPECIAWIPAAECGEDLPEEEE